MLCTYKKPTAMRETLENLPSIRQRAKEDEYTYRKRFIYVIDLCENFYHEYEKMTFFIDGLLPIIRTIVALP